MTTDQIRQRSLDGRAGAEGAPPESGPGRQDEIGIQACRPEDRATLNMEAGRELLRCAHAALALPESPCWPGFEGHEWQEMTDEMGDSNVYRGTVKFTYHVCRICGEER